MTASSMVSFSACALCSVLALAVPLRRRSAGAWCFAAGMAVFAVESFFGGISVAATDAASLHRWHTVVLIVKSFIPVTWIAFSLTYLRGDFREHLRRSRVLLAAALVIPAGLALGFRDSLSFVRSLRDGDWWIEYTLSGVALNVSVLLATIVILTNLERTLRAATGTARWKIKFAMLGLGVVFGARIYTRSQSLLFTGFNLHLTVIESSGLLVGCLLMAIALVRQGFGGIDIYPSRALLQGSVTLLLTGAYLFVVGVMAQLAAALGGAGSFQFQAIVILIGVAVLAVLLLSDRLRQRLRVFVGRHFRRPQHDARALWTAFSLRLSTLTDPRDYCLEAVKLIAESFQVLSVTIWLHDDRVDTFRRIASTVAEGSASEPKSPASLTPAAPLLQGLGSLKRPLNLDRNISEWAHGIRSATATHFPSGGARFCLPVVAGGRVMGALTLADRVNGAAYSTEELDLLKCISDQIAAGLQRFQLTEELMQGRELEAFQAMSTFFIHDLKNAASSLGLMLKNLPVHFDDPEFRRDALQGIGSTLGRINQITARLGALRQNPGIKRTTTNLIELVTGAISEFPLPQEIELVRDLQPVPPVIADPEQLESVVTNLLLNAVEAMPPAGGRITVRTSLQEDQAALSVADTGCGMTAEFVRESLFRPFRSTKKKGLGIGMFQCRSIINAHRGSLQVESEPGRGTTFRILLPLTPEPL